jgi:CRP/FNR family transcriptional regulator, cyclic AMP receptor protein
VAFTAAGIIAVSHRNKPEPMKAADYAASFAVAAASPAAATDCLALPGWGASDWRKLLEGTEAHTFKANEVVIQREAVDRALFFVAEGTLEVGVTMVDGLSVASLARIGAHSVIGEQSFFDGEPRSANVWGVTDGTLLRLELDHFRRFGDDEPALARDLLFALGRVLSCRLRMTSIRVRR